MKLLLTSAGLSNESIKKAFFELVGKEAKDIKVAFIPTAANIFGGDKNWLIKDLKTLSDLCGEVDIVDVSAIPKEMVQKRLEVADVLFFEGGSEFYLMRSIEKMDLKEVFLELLKTRVWVGVSAGSMVTGNLLSVASEDLYGEEESGDYEEMPGLGFVNFNVWPHLNSKDFPNLTLKNIQSVVTEKDLPLYVLDDNSAVMVSEDQIKVVSEGKWKKFE